MSRLRLGSVGRQRSHLLSTCFWCSRGSEPGLPVALSGPAAKATTGRHGMESVLFFLRPRHMGHSQLWLEAEEDFDDIWVEKGTKDGSTVQ